MASSVDGISNEEVAQKYTFLTEVLPDADKQYLLHKCQKYINKPAKLEKFIIECFSRQSVLRMKQRKYETNRLKELYTSNFTIEAFLEQVPDPESYFYNENRESVLDDGCQQGDIEYGFAFLRTHFNMHYVKTLRIEYARSDFNIIKTVEAIKKYPKKVLIRTKDHFLAGLETNNIELLKQIAYIEHKEEINNYFEIQKQDLQQKINQAKINGTISTCQCCYDDEIIIEKQIHCEEGHIFCTSCLQKSCEVLYGSGKINFPCLSNCPAFFTLRDLQLALPPKLFSIIAQKKNLEEVKAAGIEDLRCCPFCEFAYIPPPSDKVFRCLNETCLKRTCLSCHALDHLPLACSEMKEIERHQNYVYNQMTESLVRTCYKCNMKFIKEDGCNKMTCPCGAVMCYVCKNPVQNYAHFNGEGGDKYWLCPLFSNTDELHRRNLKDAKTRIKNEMATCKTKASTNLNRQKSKSI